MTFDSTLSRAKIYLPILRSAEAQDQWEKIIVQEILDFHGLIALTFVMVLETPLSPTLF